MTKEEVAKLTIYVFEEYYRQVTLRSDYTYSSTKIDDNALTNFISYLDKRGTLQSTNIDVIVEYIELGFHWWHQKKHLKYGLPSIKLSWVIGSSAIKRFENIKDRRFISTYHRRTLRNKVKSNILTKIKLRNDESLKSTADWLLNAKFDGEEHDKKIFYNKPEGLIYCRAHTTMFNHKSSLCSECFNRLRCKELLKTVMPRIYKMRGYV